MSLIIIPPDLPTSFTRSSKMNRSIVDSMSSSSTTLAKNSTYAAYALGHTCQSRGVGDDSDTSERAQAHRWSPSHRIQFSFVIDPTVGMPLISSSWLKGSARIAISCKRWMDDSSSYIARKVSGDPPRSYAASKLRRHAQI